MVGQVNTHGPFIRAHPLRIVMDSGPISVPTLVDLSTHTHLLQTALYLLFLMGGVLQVRVRAQNLAASDDFIEVWRGATCVYSGMPDQMPAH